MQDYIKNIAIKFGITWLTWLVNLEIEIHIRHHG